MMIGKVRRPQEAEKSEQRERGRRRGRHLKLKKGSKQQHIRYSFLLIQETRQHLSISFLVSQLSSAVFIKTKKHRAGPLLTWL